MTVDSGYRPFVLKLVAAVLSGRTWWPVKVVVLGAGASLVLLPSSLREKVLFRKSSRNEWTRNLSKNLLSHIHVD